MMMTFKYEFIVRDYGQRYTSIYLLFFKKKKAYDIGK